MAKQEFFDESIDAGDGELFINLDAGNAEQQFFDESIDAGNGEVVINVDAGDASPRLPQVNHPHDCDCAECAFLYMLLPQETIDLEEDIIIVPSSPTSSTTTVCVSDSDSDDQFSYDEELQINEDIVPGLHSPYSPIPSPYMFPESNHLALPNYMYGVDTPLSPPSSP